MSIGPRDGFEGQTQGGVTTKTLTVVDDKGERATAFGSPKGPRLAVGDRLDFIQNRLEGVVVGLER